jgi:hypothetical protein
MYLHKYMGEFVIFVVCPVIVVYVTLFLLTKELEKENEDLEDSEDGDEDV